MEPLLPLKGVRVVDLTAMLPGPYCSFVLWQLGADVVKVEQPGGDRMRKLFPSVFGWVNTGKDATVLDLKDPTDRAMLLELCTEADVFIEGFRPGVVEKLGVGYDVVRGRNRQIVYASLSGFGQAGPYSAWPAHDLNFQSVGGTYRHGDEKLPVLPVGDLSLGLFGALAVVSALRQAQATGEGSYLDLAASDALVHLMAVRMAQGNIPDERPAYGVFRCRDDVAVTVAALDDHFFKNLCDALEWGPLQRKPEWQTFAGRMREVSAINGLIGETIATRSRAEWLERFSNCDVPATPANTLDDLPRDPQFLARGTIVAAGEFTYVRFPARGVGRQEPGEFAVLADTEGAKP